MTEEKPWWEYLAETYRRPKPDEEEKPDDDQA